jgi:uncharacterized protein (DUF2249 family)
MITAETNLGQLLDEHPTLVEFLAGYHEHFAALRDRMRRRVMAPRVTVGQAATLAGVPAPELIGALRRAVGEEPGTAEAPAAPTPGVESAPRPSALERLRPVELDVRDEIRRGEEPFARIVAAAKSLGADEALVIRAPFEPVPLFDVLGRRGLAHWSERLGEADWRVWFHRAASPTAAPVAPAGGATLDVRGLEPPQPMVRVLQRLTGLGPGETLTVLHERRPTFLYPLLDERGLRHETDEPEPGLVRIVIRGPA